MKKKYVPFMLMLSLFSTMAFGQANARMAGTFTQDDSCGGYTHGQKSTVSITANFGSKTDITINAFGTIIPTYNATATLDSNAYTVTMPFQTAGLLNLTGTGTFTTNYNYMTIAWNYSGGASGSCVDTYTRKALGVYDLEDDISLKVWPNPVTAPLHFMINSNIPTATLKVFNIFGACVYSRTLNISEYQNEQTIDMKSFAAGIYMLQVENGQYISTVKVIKQ